MTVNSVSWIRRVVGGRAESTRALPERKPFRALFISALAPGLLADTLEGFVNRRLTMAAIPIATVLASSAAVTVLSECACTTSSTLEAGRLPQAQASSSCMRPTT
jgi:hypothetical protein